MNTQALLRASCTAVFVLATASEALAAEGFKLRFPLAGTLGGEIVAPMPSDGWFGSVVLTDVNVTGVSGNDGNTLQLTNAGTFAPTAADLAPAVSSGKITQQVANLLSARTATYSGTVDASIKMHQTLANLLIGNILSKDVNGGKLVLTVNIPYATTYSSDVKFTSTSPTLSSLNPAPPAPAANTLPVAANAIFSQGYQSKLAAQASDATVTMSGLGDIEASLLWEKSMDALKVVAGATLVMPTGEYEYTPGTLKPNIGFGNYYTLRTGLGVAYTASESMTLGARASLGFNSQNMDSYVRSGDYYGIDLAAAFRTPVGVVGPHITMVRQYTDDTGSALGANRLSITGAGFFYTVPIVALGKAGLNIAYMKTTDTKNSLVGDFVQARLSKVF